MEKGVNCACGENCEGREEKGFIAQLKSPDIWLRIAFMLILLMIVGLLLLFTNGETFAQDKNQTLTDTLAPIPEIVFVPRVVTGSDGQHFSEATDNMTIPKNAHVKVAIVAFGLPGALVEAVRHCQSKMTKTKKNGATTTTSDSVSTDTKPVGKTGVLLSWRQLDPSAGGSCTLTVKIGTTQKAFTVKGAE